MRYYRIVNKDTGQVYSGLRYYDAVVGKRGKNKGVVMVTGGWRPLWTDPINENYRQIQDINYQIEFIVNKQQMSILDNCEIQSYEKKFTSIKTTVKLENTRKRIEQKILMDKLKK